ncbi:hypothetical protein ACWGNE_15890 [Streptomyces xiamenensis]
MDLTARHPRTGEPLSTVKFMVQNLAAGGELQPRQRPHLDRTMIRVGGYRRFPFGPEGRPGSARTRRACP